MESKTLYGISINGKMPCEWSDKRPDVKNVNLDLSLLKSVYSSYEVIKKRITYEVDEKLL